MKENKPIHKPIGVFLRACKREKVPYTPVWFMRQAGRYMQSYRRLRARYSFLRLCRDSAAAARITAEAAEKSGADAAIIFSDILLIAEPLGLKLAYPGTGGPRLTGALRTVRRAESVRQLEDVRALGFVYEAVRLARAAIAPRTALIGFSAAPFTLAAYMIEGRASRQFETARKFMRSEPAAWRVLMEKIVRSLILHLNAQADAGADALQIFDSWAGALSPQEYRTRAMPYTAALIRGVRPGVPVIHFGTGTGPFLEDFARAGGDVIGIDHTLDLRRAWRRIGYGTGIQGNLAPEVLLKKPADIRRGVRRILELAGGRPGHIFNLGHGVLPQTPERHVRLAADAVREFSSR